MRIEVSLEQRVGGTLKTKRFNFDADWKQIHIKYELRVCEMLLWHVQSRVESSRGWR